MTEEKKKTESSQIIFFCRDCQKVVKEPKKVGNKYVYKCPVCDSKSVAFGTTKSICDYFHLKERDLE